MRKNVGVGVAVLVYHEEKLLLAKRTNSHGEGTWAPLGGHLEYGEDFATCAARECMEEGNIEIKNIRYKTITNDIFTDEEKHYITIWVEADYASGDVRVNAEDEHTEIGWFAMDDLPTPLFLSITNLLEGNFFEADQPLTRQES